MKVKASMDVLESLKESLKSEGKDAVRFEVAGFG
jgi:hypothetical protein